LTRVRCRPTIDGATPEGPLRAGAAGDSGRVRLRTWATR